MPVGLPEMGKPNAVVLLSGGLDSTVVAAEAALSFSIHALTIAYGQRHDMELAAARRVALALEVAEHRMVRVDLDVFGGSALTDDIEVPKDREEFGEIPITYVPARNLVFLSLALSCAESIGARDIFLGVNAIDYSGYPDCRPEFLRAFEEVARLGTKQGIEGHPCRIHAPLLEMGKADIVRRGIELGVDFSLTHSCYDPLPNGQACGHCDACLLRQRGFEEAGYRDPAIAG